MSITDEKAELPDQLYVASKIKSLFKRTVNLMPMCIAFPLDFIRDFTVPMADTADWNRTRGAILPVLIPWGFCMLWGFIRSQDQEENAYYLKILLILLAPTIMLGIYIRCRTT